MKDIKLYFAIFINIVLFGNTVMDVTTHIQVYKGFATKGNDFSVKASSRLACVNVCLNIAECIAIKYWPSGETCIMLHRGILTITEDINKDQVIVVKHTPGLQIQKQKYIKYEYTKEEATYICTLLDAHLMTLDELSKLFEDGYDNCSCGWLAGGIKRYISQTNTTQNGCGQEIGIVDCDLREMANVWCLPNKL